MILRHERVTVMLSGWLYVSDSETMISLRSGAKSAFIFLGRGPSL